MQTFLGDSDIHKLDGPDDADIDSDTISDMIAEGRFTEREFNTFCESFGVEPKMPDGDFHHLAAQAFLQRKRGLEIMALTLPMDDSVAGVYAALVDFARAHNLRIHCPMPLVCADIDLDDLGDLPPHWAHYAAL